MKTKTLKKGLLASVIALLVCALAAAMLIYGATGDGGAYALTFEGEPIAREYAVGSTVTLPGAKITVGGSTVDAYPETVYPGGSVTTLRSVELSETGSYTVRYRATVGGRIYSESVSFYAYNSLYSVSSSRSSVSYGTHAQAPNKEGIVVELQAGDTFDYHKPVNLFGKTYTDDGVVIYITPSVVGEMDVQQLSVRFTDAYDSSKYVTFKVRTGNENQLGYSQASVGERIGAGRQLGTQTGIHVGGIYGHVEAVSFMGLPETGGIEDNPLIVRYDYESKQVHTRVRKSDTLVADLDDIEFFDDPWTENFTTGEVYVSVWCDYYEKSAANFVITGIYDEDLTVTRITDTRAPHIMIDYDPENIPHAVAGKEYNIFPARAVDDVSGEVRVSSRVFYNYYSSSRTELDGFGGKFTPAKSGKVYIEYSATDGSGNCEPTLVEVPVLAESPAMNITLATENRVTSSVVGERIPVSDILSYDRGTVRLSVTSQSGEASVGEGYFIAPKPGTYTVKYTVTDYIGYSEDATYTVEVTAGNAPVFTEKAVLPKYLLGGYVYALPMPKACDYTDGSGKEVTVYAEVSTDGGAFARVDANAYSPTGSSAVIRYVAELAGKDSAYLTSDPISVRTVKAVDGNRYSLDVPAYFETSGIQVALADNYVSLTTQSGGSAEFVNALIADGFQLRFGVNPEANSASRVTVTLSDYADPDVSVDINFIKKASGTTANVNGGHNYTISAASFSDGNYYNISYNNETRQLTLDDVNGVYVDLVKAIDGFTGFASGRVYMSITVAGAGSTELFVTEVCGQVFNSRRATENGRPNVSYSSPSDGAINKVYTVKGAVAADVFSPSVKFTVSVYNPGGDVMKSTDGVLLDKISAWESYDILIDEYGSYSVEYSANDGNGNTETLTYSINIVNTTAPVITVDGSKIKTSVKAGTVVDVPTATAVDDVDGKVDVTVYLIVPSGKMTVFTDKRFTASAKGMYRVIYTATDLSYNTALVSFDIVVE